MSKKTLAGQAERGSSMIDIAPPLRLRIDGKGSATWQNHSLPLVGRVSMDLTTFDVSDAPGIGEGDWLAIDYDLLPAAQRSGLSHYKLLTSLGARYARCWS